MDNWVPDELNDDLLQKFKNGHLYYRTSCVGTPHLINRFPLANFDRILGFSSFNLTNLIIQSVLFMVRSEALPRWKRIETFENLPTDNKELCLIEGANHFAIYDEELYVSQAVERMKAFFDKNI